VGVSTIKNKTCPGASMIFDYVPVPSTSHGIYTYGEKISTALSGSIGNDLNK
jgi:hypothetical protein